MKRSIFLLLILSLTFAPAAFGQKPPKKKPFLKSAQDKRDFDEAELLFIQKNFAQALRTYQKMEIDHPTEPVLIYRIGVCLFFQDGGYIKSLEYLNKLDEKKFKKTDILYYKGRNLHMDYKFTEAIDYFTRYISNKWADPKLKTEAEQFVKYC